MTDFDEEARQFFAAQIERQQAPAEPITDQPESGSDPDTAWLDLLTPEELDRASHDAAFADQMASSYRQWAAGQNRPTRPRAPAPIATETADVSPAVLAYESGRVPYAALSRGDRDAAIERVVGPPPTAAVGEFEQGLRETNEITEAEYHDALRREFARRTARAVAERGGRP